MRENDLIGIVLRVMLCVTVAVESSCSAPERIICTGNYHQAGPSGLEARSRAVLGFRIERASLLAKAISPKGWKGFLSVSYSAIPFGQNYSGSGVLTIGTDNQWSLLASDLIGGKGQSLMFDPMTDTVSFEDDRLSPIRDFNGLCRRQDD